jgi:tetratricopeptide (TPR) repeat protein
MKDYFEVLSIEEDVDAQTIKKAYKAMLDKFPEDQFPEQNQEIEEAFRALSDAAIRTACIEFHRMEASSKQAYKEAHTAIDDGKYSKAARLLEKVVKGEKYTTHLNYLLGIAYMNLNKAAKAVKALESVRGDYPYDMDLNMLFIKACLGAKKYDEALALAKECFLHDSDNFTLVYLLVEGYMLSENYKEASILLKEAIEDPKFREERYYICARLSYSLFMEARHNESLDMMDRLVDFDVEHDEINESLDLFVHMLEFYIDSHRFADANRCAGVLLKLCPGREDIAGIKEGIEKIIKLEPELMRFEKDEFIPDLLKIYTTNGSLPDDFDEVSEEQKRAYAVLMEYQILNDYSNCLMALRYMSNNYPALYELKADFFDCLQNSRERKKLFNKNKALFYQYHGIIDDLVSMWDDEYGDDEDGYGDGYGGDDGDDDGDGGDDEDGDGDGGDGGDGDGSDE